VGYVTDFSGGKKCSIFVLKSLLFSVSAATVAADNFSWICTEEYPVVTVLCLSQLQMSQLFCHSCVIGSGH
jgi:hypothetical protein